MHVCAQHQFLPPRSSKSNASSRTTNYGTAHTPQGGNAAPSSRTQRSATPAWGTTRTGGAHSNTRTLLTAPGLKERVDPNGPPPPDTRYPYTVARHADEGGCPASITPGQSPPLSGTAGRQQSAGTPRAARVNPPPSQKCLCGKERPVDHCYPTSLEPKTELTREGGAHHEPKGGSWILAGAERQHLENHHPPLLPPLPNQPSSHCYRDVRNKGTPRQRDVRDRGVDDTTRIKSYWSADQPAPPRALLYDPHHYSYEQ